MKKRRKSNIGPRGRGEYGYLPFQTLLQKGYKMLRIRTEQPPQPVAPTVERLTVNTEEAAKMIGISPRMVFNLTRSGVLHCKRIGRRVLYSVTEIRRFIDGEPAAN